jgi:D-alanine transaminase
MIVYFNEKFIRKEDVHISPDDRGFLLGDGTYEVVRIYRGRPFRIEEHLKRLANSLRQIHLGFPDLDRMDPVTDELIRQNRLENADAALYVHITRGVAPRRHPFPEPGTPPTVYASVYPVIPPVEKWENGVKAILVPDLRWGRCDIKSVSLLANVLAAQQAAEQDAEEAVFVREGIVTEGTHTNVAAVMEGMVWTHPVANHILNGITREVTRELCGELRIPFREEPVPEARFKKADEIMLLGTTTEIMPIVRLDDRPVGTGTPGPITKQLQQAFFRLTRS